MLLEEDQVMDLVILAAGMGSRFGGLKQLEPIDKYGNFIIDYSIYDAKRAGFDKVVFIIKEENYEIFKNTIGKRVEDKIETKYAFQTLDLIPEGYTLPKDRVKPLGTAQAILAAKPYVDDSFIIINADDFYGEDAFKVAASYLQSAKAQHRGAYANVAYGVANTMTENGSVKRGVLSFDKNNKLESLCEAKIERKNGVIVAEPLDGTPEFTIPADTLVSMNMFCFTHDIFDFIEGDYKKFMDANLDNLDKCEYLIPQLVSDKINEGECTVEVLSTTAKWYGITYKSDKPAVVESLEALMKGGAYPEGLWK